MRRLWGYAGIVLAVAAGGCRNVTGCWPWPGSGETIVSAALPPAPDGMSWQLVPNSGAPAVPGPSLATAPCPPLAEPPARFGVPTSEACPPAACPPAAPKTVFVRAPQQKIVIERDCPPRKEAPRQEAPRQEAPQSRPTQEQAAAVVAAPDVLLVPRTVYVPYVAQTPTRAARLVTPAALPSLPPPAEPERTPQQQQKKPPPEDVPTQPRPQPCPVEICPTECQPTTVIEIRQMNERIDRLHRIMERLLPGHRQ